MAGAAAATCMSDFQSTALAASTATACRVRFAAASAGISEPASTPTLAVAIPVLAGPGDEVIVAGAGSAETRHGCVVLDGGDELAGFAVAPADLDLESAARELYFRTFAAVDGRRLCRVWNYVPHINAVTDGMENYRRFCRGRSLAFEEQFGRAFQRQLPAASAVGAAMGPLAIAFFATNSPPRHFENPCQVPAFEYPADYGPRPPSFSRASMVTTRAGRQIFISGTASIRGHATIGPDDLDVQLPCTLANLELIAETAGAGAAVGASDGWRRAFKVYLRNAADLDRARAFLERHLLRLADSVTYLEAGICRADLRVEIEAVLTTSR